MRIKHLCRLAEFGKKYNNSTTVFVYLRPFHFFALLLINGLVKFDMLNILDVRLDVMFPTTNTDHPPTE